MLKDAAVLSGARTVQLMLNSESDFSAVQPRTAADGAVQQCGKSTPKPIRLVARCLSLGAATAFVAAFKGPRAQSALRPREPSLPVKGPRARDDEHGFWVRDTTESCS